MKLLKNIPIQYKGELHDIQLINFSVEIGEVLANVPTALKVRNFDGRAMISMVNVDLKKMHPVFLPELLNFNYQHLAFRLLVDDTHLNEDGAKGIYFYQSFTNQAHIVWGGSLMTDYNLSKANIINRADGFELTQGDKFIHCTFSDTSPKPLPELKATVGAIDRAYSIRGEKVMKTQILREKWPLEGLKCTHFETNFFKTARLEGAFRVPEVIYYRWLPAVAVEG